MYIYMHKKIYTYIYLAMRQTIRGTIWLPQQKTWVGSTGVPGGAPDGTSGTLYSTGPRRHIKTQNMFE